MVRTLRSSGAGTGATRERFPVRGRRAGSSGFAGEALLAEGRRQRVVLGVFVQQDGAVARRERSDHGVRKRDAMVGLEAGRREQDGLVGFPENAGSELL